MLIGCSGAEIFALSKKYIYFWIIRESCETLHTFLLLEVCGNSFVCCFLPALCTTCYQITVAEIGKPLCSRSLKIEVKYLTHLKNNFFTEITGSFKAVQTLRLEVAHHSVVTTPEVSDDHQTSLLPVRLIDFSSFPEFPQPKQFRFKNKH